MSNSIETRIMGIDFGVKRIGIALSDSMKMFSIAHKTILNNSTTLEELEKIIKEKNVIKIILGIPNEQRQKKNPKLQSLLMLKSLRISWKKSLSLKLNFGMKLILLQSLSSRYLNP